MEPTLDEIREELAGIHDQLLLLPTDAFAERARLKEKQQALRQLSYKLAEGEPMHDSAVLKAAFTRLQQERDRLYDAKLPYSSTSVGDAGIEADFTAAVNKAIDAGTGIDEIEARLEEILKQLKSSH